VRTCFGASCTYKIFFGKKIKISIFGGISKFLKLIVFGQISTKFDKFGLFWANSMLWQWLRACPHLKGKKENVITFAKSVRILRVMACWKTL
jgi:hypothetical protein